MEQVVDGHHFSRTFSNFQTWIISVEGEIAMCDVATFPSCVDSTIPFTVKVLMTQSLCDNHIAVFTVQPSLSSSMFPSG